MKTSRNDGFSLIEILTVLSIMAIGVTLAVPSWNEARSKRHIVDSSENLALFIATGRSLAVKHNRNVSVSLVYQGSGSWCIGMTDRAVACDCTVQEPDRPGFCAIGSVPYTLHESELERTEMVSHAEDTQFVFDRVRGNLVSSDVSEPHYFRLSSTDGALGLQVGVSPTGTTFVCRWVNNGALSAYRSCEPVADDAEPSGDSRAIDL